MKSVKVVKKKTNKKISTLKKIEKGKNITQFGQLFANLDRLVVSENICETHFCR